MIRVETTRDVAQRAPVTLQKASPYPVQVTNTMERILVVEDDHAVQKALRRLFEAEGFEIEISADGKSALEAFRRAAPAAIVLDLRLAAGFRPGRLPRDQATGAVGSYHCFKRRQRCFRQSAPS